MSRNQSQCSCLPSLLDGNGFCITLSMRFLKGIKVTTKRWIYGLILFCLCASQGISALAETIDETHAGFIFDRHALTLEAGSRTEAAGPFFYEQQTEMGNL